MQNKKNLYIIGAGGMAREIENALLEVPLSQRDWELKGFLYNIKNNESPLKGFPTSLKIIGNWDDFNFTSDDICIIGVGNCDWRKKIYNTLKGKVDILTYVHPSSIVYKYANIGEGSVIMQNCFISTNVNIGAATFINVGTLIGHDTIIGDYSCLMSHIGIGGWCEIGKEVYIGSNAVIIPHKIIGDNARIGAGAVVIKKVKSGKTVFGNPASVISEK